MDRAARAIDRLLAEIKWFTYVSNHHNEAVALKARIILRQFLESDDAKILLNQDDGN